MRITFLIGELQKTRKDNLNIDQYLSKVKLLASNVEVTGKAIPLPDLITQILAGLDEEYTPIVVQINSRDSISWEELQSILMTFESILDHINAIKNEMAGINLSQSSANFTQRAFNNNYSRKNYNCYNGGRSHYNGNYRGGRRGGRNRGRTDFNNLPTCQVYGKVGNKANICNYRYDDSYNGPAAPHQNNFKNHTPSAFVASPETINDPVWLANQEPVIMSPQMQKISVKPVSTLVRRKVWLAMEANLTCHT